MQYPRKAALVHPTQEPLKEHIPRSHLQQNVHQYFVIWSLTLDPLLHAFNIDNNNLYVALLDDRVQVEEKRSHPVYFPDRIHLYE